MVFQIGNKDDLAINKPECVCVLLLVLPCTVVWVALSGGRQRARERVYVGVCLSILVLNSHDVMGSIEKNCEFWNCCS